MFKTQKFAVLLQQYYEKKVAKGQLWNISQDGVNLTAINLFAKSFCSALTQDLKQHRYEFSPVHERIFFRNGKKRFIYPLNVSDFLVQKYLAKQLAPFLYTQLTNSCYAYIPGKNNLLAVTDFATYLRKTQNDIYVLRTDISNYTDSIPLQEGALFWPMLDALVKQLSLSTEDYAYITKLLKSAIRPTIINSQGNAYQKICGAPTGIPLLSIVANLYLAAVDKKILTIPNIFYARYGDDILIAHEKADTVLSADNMLTAQLNLLKLQRNPIKDQHIYLTRAGKAHPSTIWRGSNWLEYLGYAINRQGNITFTTKRLKKLRQNLSERFKNYYSLIHEFPVVEQCRYLANLVNQLLDSNNPLHNKQLLELIQYCTDRGQLKQLDFFIAQIIAEKITGKKCLQAFHRIPYKKLRQTYGLTSLVRIKNKT